MSSLRDKARRAHHSSPDVIIGKNGITEGVIREIRARLEAKGIVKVKMLRTALEGGGLDRREAARLVAQLAGARLMGVRGRTFVLARQGGERRSLSPRAARGPWRAGEPWSRRWTSRRTGS